MKKIEKISMPLGMVGVIGYMLHTIIGNLLWKQYNPITTDISSLTAVGAPNAVILKFFTSVYGICTILFVAGLIIKSFRKYHLVTRVGYVVMMIMQIVSMVGYSLFPLTGDKTVMNFQNRMHIVVTVVVMFTTISYCFILAVGYLKQEKIKKLGRFVLIMSIVITLTGATNPIGMGMRLNILGLTERLVIYSLQFMMFTLSYYYTFNKDEKSYLDTSALKVGVFYKFMVKEKL
ncbi:DUF998 domain-containing protein [Clostridium sp. CF011]|uniref:DUF998 domain-containing protein n=1 Tax=Clostridium sp. CF011 TaxID=2843318 RepID=UPI00209B4601|nr:DUF998 domain-containing protein [Clostridium sp. CF011]WAG71261.1 DUF998 domain-containing protein [Clostridium sp. CF011]